MGGVGGVSSGLQLQRTPHGRGLLGCCEMGGILSLGGLHGSALPKSEVTPGSGPQL